MSLNVPGGGVQPSIATMLTTDATGDSATELVFGGISPGEYLRGIVLGNIVPCQENLTAILKWADIAVRLGQPNQLAPEDEPIKASRSYKLGWDDGYAEGFGKASDLSASPANGSHVKFMQIPAGGYPALDGQSVRAEPQHNDVAGLPTNSMAEGCCSAISPCSHQQRDPISICESCQRAAVAETNAAAPGDTGLESGGASSDPVPLLDREAVCEFISKWIADGHLQTFEDRERFRKEGRAILSLSTKPLVGEGVQGSIADGGHKPEQSGRCLSLAWRTIETAPKDGTKIDLLYPYPRGRFIDAQWRSGGVYGDGGWYRSNPRWGSQPGLGIDWHLLPESEWSDECLPNMNPTHWMPSPSSTSATATETDGGEG